MGAHGSSVLVRRSIQPGHADRTERSIRSLVTRRVARGIARTLAVSARQRHVLGQRRTVRPTSSTLISRFGPPLQMQVFLPYVAIPVGVLFTVVTACAPANPRGTAQPNTGLTAEDIEKNPNEPIEKQLQAKTPGLSITRGDDGSIAVQIRGNHSFVGTDAPLYVLDGMPFEPGPGGLLNGIDPYTIESIKVFKGTEAVLYGIRGMNGVIAITTKKPEKRNR